MREVDFSFGNKPKGISPKVDKHAVERAIERFNVPKDQAKKWVNDNFRQSKYISKVLDRRDKELHLFSYNGIIFAVSEDFKTIFTVYPFEAIEKERIKPENNVVKQIKNKMNNLIHIEIKKAQMEERKTKNKNSLTIAELEVELAQLKLFLMRARSESKKKAYMSRINAIQLRIEELDNEIHNKSQKLRIIAKTVSQYI